MKKLLIMLIATVAMISCKQNENIPFDKTASEGIAGTYSGTWLRTLKTDSVSGEGTIMFVAGEQPNVCTITVSCANPAISRTGICNVAHSDDEYVFYNNSTSDAAGFGTKFSGRVYKDGSVDMQYSIEEQVGRFKDIYNFSFAGNKQ